MTNNKLVNFLASLNNLKAKVHDLNAGKLKAVPVYLKKMIDVVDNEVVKSAKFNTLKSKLNHLKKNSWCKCIISHESIQINK